MKWLIFIGFCILVPLIIVIAFIKFPVKTPTDEEIDKYD